MTISAAICASLHCFLALSSSASSCSIRFLASGITGDGFFVVAAGAEGELTTGAGFFFAVLRVGVLRAFSTLHPNYVTR